jgi:hypothetical protein
MTRTAKILLIFAGYAIALLVALGVTHAHQVATSGPAWQGYSGMLAFGDSVLFLGVFGLTAVPATGAALYFLRPVRVFWRVASIVALTIAATGIAAFLGYLMFGSTEPASGIGLWVSLTPLRILLAPLFGAAFFLGLLFAPSRSARLAFLAATVIEAVIFIWVVFMWWLPSR